MFLKCFLQAAYELCIWTRTVLWLMSCKERSSSRVTATIQGLTPRLGRSISSWKILETKQIICGQLVNPHRSSRSLSFSKKSHENFTSFFFYQLLDRDPGECGMYSQASFSQDRQQTDGELREQPGPRSYCLTHFKGNSLKPSLHVCQTERSQHSGGGS